MDSQSNFNWLLQKYQKALRLLIDHLLANISQLLTVCFKFGDKFACNW